MIKEFLANKLIELLHLGRLADLQRSVTDLETYIQKADIANQRGIEFLLDRVEVNDKFFDNYKWDLYMELPWYIKRLFRNKYGLNYYTSDGIGKLAIQGAFVGNETEPLAKILDSIKEKKKMIKEINKEFNKISKGKK